MISCRLGICRHHASHNRALKWANFSQISQYCTGAMSRVRLIGLITAVCTPFGLDTSINQIRIASTRCYPRRAGGERCRSWLLGAFGGPCWGKELLFCPKSPKKSQIWVHFPRSPPPTTDHPTLFPAWSNKEYIALSCIYKFLFTGYFTKWA